MNTDIKYKNSKWGRLLGFETKQALAIISQMFWLYTHIPNIRTLLSQVPDSEPMILAISANNSTHNIHSGRADTTQAFIFSAGFTNGGCWHKHIKPIQQ